MLGEITKAAYLKCSLHHMSQHTQGNCVFMASVTVGPVLQLECIQSLASLRGNSYRLNN